MKTFKVGEKCVVYQGCRQIGTILYVDGSDIYRVQLGGNAYTYSVHAKQMRKLKPKRGPRRVWVHPDRMTDNVSVNMEPTYGWVEFIEVIK